MSVHPRATPSRLMGVVLAAVLGIGLIAVAPTAALAVPPPVETLRPSQGDAVSGIPTLTWARAGSAARYRVQASTSSSFGTTLFSVETTSSRYVPRVQLPVGRIYWRVQVTGEQDWSQTSFDRDAVPAPGSVSPAGGQSLPQPKSPPLLDWSPVPGALSYTVELSTDELFVDPNRTRTYTTKSSSFIVPGLQAPTLYFWRVKADLGNGAASEFSETGSYEIEGLGLAEIQDESTDTFSPAVQDVDLDWKPVLGAATYDLQVSTDENFLNSGALIENVSGITSTRYARARTLNNNEYYWRVRPVDAAGTRRDWSAATIWQFRRDWPDQPRLEYPANGTTVGDPFYFQWSGTPLASSYVLELSSTSNFEPASQVKRCSTVHTTLTPAVSGATTCMPSSGGTFFWRVQAVDGPGGAPVTELVTGAPQINRFTYRPDLVTLRTPAPGATVSVPSLTWDPLAGAAQYQVTVTGPGTSRTAVVSGTTWTPGAALPLGKVVAGSDPVRHEPVRYTWQVRPVSEDGRIGPGLLFEEDGRSFTLVDQPAAASAAPHPTSATANLTSYRFPGLAWQPVAGAVSYELYVGPAGTGSFSRVGGSFSYPAGEDTSGNLGAAGTYSWFVRAIGTGGAVLSTGSQGVFTIEELDAVPDGEHWAALTGTSLTGDLGTTVDRCDATLPAQCQNLRQTPVLSWPANPDAGYYRLYLSNDATLTNPVTDNGVRFPVNVFGNTWTPPTALPDSQAGSAYFWTVTPCTYDGHCTAPARATHAFNKLSRQVTLFDPPDGETRANDVTLRWEDYLTTQGRASTSPVTTASGSADQDSSTTLRTRARMEARTYRVQVSDDPNFAGTQTFQSITDVDQRHLTASTTTYPEGPIYWRVQAIDGTGNPLAWSERGSFTKSSPAPTCLAPNQARVGGCPVTTDPVPSDEPLTWAPVAFAAGYDVEVYKNNDTVGQPVNRVSSATVQNAAISWSRPIPPSDVTYTWRVRRTDVAGRKGAWSDWATFQVRAGLPVLGLPFDGAQVDPVDPVFAWSALEGAATYRFERRNSSGATIETIDTPALAWAPTTPLGNGVGSWRVTGIDNDGKVMAQPTTWRTFSATTSISPTVDAGVSGTGRVGNALSASLPTWDISTLGKQVDTTLQWFRGTSRIGGATGSTYILTPADSGSQVYVVATGSSPGYTNGVSTSNRVTVGPGTAVAAQSNPAITGNAIVKGVLTATPGTWPAGATFAYQWLRDGAAVSGATRQAYTVQAADAGRGLTVRVTATAPGYDPGQATSSGVRIGKVDTTTTISAPAKISRKAKAKVTVTVVAPGIVDPTGTVVVLDGAKRVAAGQVTAGAAGKVVLKLKKLKPGKHQLKAVFSGSDTVRESTSGTKKLKVVKR